MSSIIVKRWNYFYKKKQKWEHLNLTRKYEIIGACENCNVSRSEQCKMQSSFLLTLYITCNSNDKIRDTILYSGRNKKLDAQIQFDFITHFCFTFKAHTKFN